MTIKEQTKAQFTLAKALDLNKSTAENLLANGLKGSKVTEEEVEVLAEKKKAADRNVKSVIKLIAEPSTHEELTQEINNSKAGVARGSKAKSSYVVIPLDVKVNVIVFVCLVPFNNSLDGLTFLRRS